MKVHYDDKEIKNTWIQEDKIMAATKQKIEDNKLGKEVENLDKKIEKELSLISEINELDRSMLK